MFDGLRLPPSWRFRIEYSPETPTHPLALSVYAGDTPGQAMMLPVGELRSASDLQRYLDMFTSGAVDDIEELGPGEFPPLPDPLPSRYDSPPRGGASEPRHGDAFLVEGRRVPLTVDIVLGLLNETGLHPDGMPVRASDGSLWRVRARPDTDDGPAFPAFEGVPLAGA